jgi:long-subunit fatty acid transport protein
MTIARRVGALLTVIVATFGLSTNAAAQTNDEIFPQFQWNFSTPGARANAMGRTFVGMADDATAVVTNPAGLISLTKPQVYAEYKNTDIKVDRLAAIDSLITLQPTTSTTNVNALSFFSLSTPIGSRIGVGFSYHQFLNYQESFHLSPRTVRDAATNLPVNFVTFGVEGEANFKGSSFGGSVAFAVTPQFRLGLTVSENHLSATSEGKRFDTIFGPTFLKNGVVSNPNDLTETSIIVNQTSINDSNNAFGWAFGALLRPNDNFSVGFDYTKGPSFKINERFLFNPGRNLNNPALGTNQPLIPIGSGFADPTALNIHVPDHFGVGVAGRPIPRLLVAFDVVRVKYSSLEKDFVTTLDFSTALSPSQFTVDDATEAHFGGEYNIITGPNPVFVRAGVYTNPNHNFKFTTSANISANLNNYYNAVYNQLPRDTEVKGTFGGGVVLGPRFQLDLAYIWKKEFVASTAVRF